MGKMIEISGLNKDYSGKKVVDGLETGLVDNLLRRRMAGRESPVEPIPAF